MDLTPHGERPYVSNSQNNRVMDLIFGVNGIFRLTNKGDTLTQSMNSPIPEGDPAKLLEEAPAQPGREGEQALAPKMIKWITSLTKKMIPDPEMLKNNPLSFEVGLPGPLRLFNFKLGPQISWFLPPIPCPMLLH